ncbi:enoyl-CoA hydratase [Plasmodium brasilianum]|uniref:Enoyl-CoA hydratase, putative n=2 Tax=Plasmodium (Plasmodium) TaxID=418103 RepID=A0A1A8W968_PLAMA|nr:enoyl-CoA hydratase, putative [Plasmodium malariae]KAI4835766.1 enoyl-CoA hydratase [Plasmodium brasilianum]SBS89567.1 enoyl-CoA hydratase, putative [Plasmodium malariae]SCP02702.1 enoyl-CoA hydratase, putative [Plasmodium malariae]
MIWRRNFFLNMSGNKRMHSCDIGGKLRYFYNNLKRYKGISSEAGFHSTRIDGKVEGGKNSQRMYFRNHNFIDFFRDETRNIGIITFKDINDKKNIFHSFLEELKNVIEHINNVITNEENNTFYINTFKKKEDGLNNYNDNDNCNGSEDNYLMRNIRNRIPYYDNKLKVLIFNSTTCDAFRETERSPTFLSSLGYNSYLKGDEENNINIANSFRYLCNAIQHLPLITVSNINGQCHNCGMDIILSTDFRISNNTSSFGFDKTYAGLYPYGGSVQKLLRHIPLNYSKYLLLTSQVINAYDALKINLIDICINKNEDFFINNSNIFFEEKLNNTQKFAIIKDNILKHFNNIFNYDLFQTKKNDDSFVFTLFFAFQFLFIPTHILQNIKLSINEGIQLNDINSYLDCDKNIFEKNINSSQRLDILNYIKRKSK